MLRYHLQNSPLAMGKFTFDQFWIMSVTEAHSKLEKEDKNNYFIAIFETDFSKLVTFCVYACVLAYTSFIGGSFYKSSNFGNWSLSRAIWQYFLRCLVAFCTHQIAFVQLIWTTVQSMHFKGSAPEWVMQIINIDSSSTFINFNENNLATYMNLQQGIPEAL